MILREKSGICGFKLRLPLGVALRKSTLLWQKLWSWCGKGIDVVAEIDDVNVFFKTLLEIMKNLVVEGASLNAGNVKNSAHLFH